MTYTVEFDRIHYPLPLTYSGKTDPSTLKRTIRELRDEVELLRGKLGDGDGEEFQRLVDENKELIEELSECREQMSLLQTGNVGKELKVLKKVVHNLEVGSKIHESRGG